ncbi:MAG: hypothetical protein ACLPI9_05795 [Halobacteriota archaeon]
MLFNVILSYVEVFSAPGEWRQLRSSKGVKIPFTGFLNGWADENGRMPPGLSSNQATDHRGRECHYFHGALAMRLSIIATSAYSVKIHGK